jgi:hypothetical protein
MMPEDTEHNHDPVEKKGKHDWVSIGSLVLIAISLLSMACIVWTRYEVGR